jgi:sugar lactone lactonase YvrE
LRRTVACSLAIALVAGVPAAAGLVTVTATTASALSPDPTGTIYVADAGTNSLDVFAPGANGNVAPVRTISGLATGLDEPGDVKVDAAGDLYTANFLADTVTEYAPGASGNASPICTISGSNPGLDRPDDISLAPDGTLYVGNNGNSVVDVFAPGACGNVSPLRVIGGSATGLTNADGVDGLGVDATGTLYADNTGGATVQVFAPGANGNVAPVRSIGGSMTGLGGPDDIVVSFSGQLYVSNGFSTGTNSVTVYAPGANGNVAPVQQIQGSSTGFGNPDDLGLDAVGDIYVTDGKASAGPPARRSSSSRRARTGTWRRSPRSPEGRPP